MNLPTEFEEIREFLGRIPSINNGGCGYAALALSIVAERHKLYHQFIYAYKAHYELNYQDNMRYFETGNEEFLSGPCHIVLLVGENLIDSITINVPAIIYKRMHPVSKQFLIKSLDKPLWNHSFNKDKYIPLIEDKLGQPLINDQWYNEENKIINCAEEIEYLRKHFNVVY